MARISSFMVNLSVSWPKWICTPTKDIVDLPLGHVSLGSAILFEGNKVLVIKHH